MSVRLCAARRGAGRGRRRPGTAAQAAQAAQAAYAAYAAYGAPATHERATSAAPAVLGEPVLSSCGAVFTWGDVAASMADDGSWALVARRAAAGRALAAAGVATPTGTALRAAASRFRRARSLGAAEDLEAWFAHWSISTEQWVDWLERSLRCDDVLGPFGTFGAAADAIGDDVVPGDGGGAAGDLTDVWVDAVCSGALEGGARRLATALGAWAARADGEPPPAGHDRWAALRRAHEELVTLAPPRDELERVVVTNAAGWLRIALACGCFATPDAGREAVACCRDDGAAFAAVAERAGIECNRVDVCADDLHERLRAAAVSSPVGTPVLVGTPEEPGLVIVVLSREHPSLDDPVVGQLATESCVAQRVQSAIDRWVTWRG